MAAALATLDDLAAWLDDDLPVNAPAYLRSASAAVYDFTSVAVYRTDPATGLPLDAGLAGTFRDATCAQAAWLITADIDPNGGGTDAPEPMSVSLGSAAINYGAAANESAAARQAALGGLCQDARRIIQQAGLNRVILETPSWITGRSII